jgi:U4/U6 small nuclear ribonucleoprotein PRP3
LKQKIAETVKKTGLEKELDLVADESLRRDPPPVTEWWDTPLMNGDYSNEIDFNVLSAEGETLITNLIQHPVPIQPPGGDEIEPLKVMLTKKVLSLSV